MKNYILKWLIIIWAFTILFMPNAIRFVSILYSVDADSYVSENLWINQHAWLHYSFSYLEVFSVLTAIFLKLDDKHINIRPIVLLIIGINIIRFLASMTNMFQFNDYSLLLSLLSGYGCYLLLTSSKIANIDIEDLLDSIIIFNTITQFMFIFTGRQMEYGGRYGALGSDVGSVGVICSQYLIYFIFCRNSKKRSLLVLTCCLISLILSGSRSNLLFAVFFIVVFVFRLHKSCKANSQTSRAIGILALIILLFTPIISTVFVESNISTVFDRMLGILKAISMDNKGYFESDGSMVGRLMSFNAGLAILADNPFGISASTIDLQMETIKNGYVSFPHSTMLSYYLLWSVATAVIYFYIIKWIIRAIKEGKRVWIFLLYFLITSIIYGGPVVNAKNYFWYLLMFTYCRNNILGINESKQKLYGKSNSIVSSSIPSHT